MDAKEKLSHQQCIFSLTFVDFHLLVCLQAEVITADEWEDLTAVLADCLRLLAFNGADTILDKD